MDHDYEFDWDKYLDWLISIIETDEDPEEYRAVLLHLLETEFKYLTPLDRDRALEGLELRRRYIRQTGEEEPDMTCSVLEMLVALCEHIESTMSTDPDKDNPGFWFWQFLKNAELDISNRYYRKSSVDHILTRINYKKFEKNGRGWFFPLKRSRKDTRNFGVWEGAMAYVNENHKVW